MKPYPRLTPTMRYADQAELVNPGDLKLGTLFFVNALEYAFLVWGGPSWSPRPMRLVLGALQNLEPDGFRAYVKRLELGTAYDDEFEVAVVSPDAGAHERRIIEEATGASEAQLAEYARTQDPEDLGPVPVDVDLSPATAW